MSTHQIDAALEVDCPPPLTAAERLMLCGVTTIIDAAVWGAFLIPRTRWTPKQNEHGHPLYCLTPYDDLANVRSYYTEDEIRRLTKATVLDDLSSGRRKQLPSGFFDRPLN